MDAFAISGLVANVFVSGIVDGAKPVDEATVNGLGAGSERDDDKGDVSNRDNGSCPGGKSRLVLDFGRVSCCVTGLSLSPVTACLVCTRYSSAEKLSPLRYRCHKNIFLTRQTAAASS
ncbi:hypothetical protein V6N13_030780 [Hibiscus sabdariffa]